MFGKPQEQHRGLDQFVGSWRIEQTCHTPDGKTNQVQSEMTCRMLGGLWLILDQSGTSDEGDWTCMTTLGYDPKKNQYIGTFVGSMMTHMWEYQGQVDASGKRLPLSTVGPTFDGAGTANYRDTIEVVSADVWRFTSDMEQKDGEWSQIMAATHTRK